MCYWVWSQGDPQRAGVNYDKEFIVCSLDLLSGLAEGLGSSIESLVWFSLHYCLLQLPWENTLKFMFNLQTHPLDKFCLMWAVFLRG